MWYFFRRCFIDDMKFYLYPWNYTAWAQTREEEIR